MDAGIFRGACSSALSAAPPPSGFPRVPRGVLPLLSSGRVQDPNYFGTNRFLSNFLPVSELVPLRQNPHCVRRHRRIPLVVFPTWYFTPSWSRSSTHPPKAKRLRIAKFGRGSIPEDPSMVFAPRGFSPDSRRGSIRRVERSRTNFREIGRSASEEERSGSSEKVFCFERRSGASEAAAVSPICFEGMETGADDVSRRDMGIRSWRREISNTDTDGSSVRSDHSWRNG